MTARCEAPRNARRAKYAYSVWRRRAENRDSRLRQRSELTPGAVARVGDTVSSVRRFSSWTCTSRRGSTGVADEDIQHAASHGSELAIHAMKMRPKYQRLLPGG